MARQFTEEELDQILGDEPQEWQEWSSIALKFLPDWSEEGLAPLRQQGWNIKGLVMYRQSNDPDWGPPIELLGNGENLDDEIEEQFFDEGELPPPPPPDDEQGGSHPEEEEQVVHDQTVDEMNSPPPPPPGDDHNDQYLHSDEEPLSRRSSGEPMPPPMAPPPADDEDTQPSHDDAQTPAVATPRRKISSPRRRSTIPLPPPPDDDFEDATLPELDHTASGVVPPPPAPEGDTQVHGDVIDADSPVPPPPPTSDDSVKEPEGTAASSSPRELSAGQQEALRTLKRLDALPGADPALTELLKESIMRDLATTKEIDHVRKAIKKKKHDAAYYIPKWQKKVKYARELEAWEKQNAALLAAEAEAEAEAKAKREREEAERRQQLEEEEEEAERERKAEEERLAQEEEEAQQREAEEQRKRDREAEAKRKRREAQRLAAEARAKAEADKAAEAEAAAEKVAAEARAAAELEAASQRRIWVPLKTEDGEVYYYNEETEETTWDKPDDDLIVIQSEPNESTQQQSEPETVDLTNIDEVAKTEKQRVDELIRRREARILQYNRIFGDVTSKHVRNWIMQVGRFLFAQDATASDVKRMFDVAAFCWLRLFDCRSRKMYWHNGFTHELTWSEPAEVGRVANHFDGYQNRDVWDKIDLYHPRLTGSVILQCAWRQFVAKSHVQRLFNRQNALRGVNKRRKKRWGWLDKFKSWFGGADQKSVEARRKALLEQQRFYFRHMSKQPTGKRVAQAVVRSNLETGTAAKRKGSAVLQRRASVADKLDDADIRVMTQLILRAITIQRVFRVFMKLKYSRYNYGDGDSSDDDEETAQQKEMVRKRLFAEVCMVFAALWVLTAHIGSHRIVCPSVCFYMCMLILLFFF